MKTLKQQLGIGVVVFFCVLGALMMDAHADDSPTPQDYANLEDIKNNQKILEETREAHERFMQAKAWNEAEVSALGKNGWTVNWETMDLERVLIPAYDNTSQPEEMDQAGPTGKRHEMLADACDGIQKCICINHAIFKHDSSWATAGVGKRANNPCNMRVPATWKPSVKIGSLNSVNGKFAKFNSLQDGVTACVELYQRLYSDLPPEKLVSRWTDGGGNTAYRSAVKSCYGSA